MIKSRTKIIVLITLSLLSGVGLAGGLYIVSTPTDVAPRAASSVSPAASLPAPITNYQLPITPSPAPLGPLTRQEIIASFGQTNPRADLNADGTVNSLDLAAFDNK